MTFISVLFLATIGFVALDLYLPSLPFIAEELETSNKLVQLTLASYLLSFSLSQLYFGPLSEKVGRKKTAISGLAWMILGSGICIASLNVFFLIFGRFLEGVGAGAAAAVFRSMLRDVYHGDELSQKGSYIAVGASFFMVAAPAIGGYIQSGWGWRYSFAFVALYTALILVFILFFLKETSKELNSRAVKFKTIKKNYSILIRSPIFMGYSGCAIFSFGGIATYLSLSPFLFHKVLRLSSVDYGWTSIFMAAGIGLGGFLNGFLVKRLGRHRLLQFGAWIQLGSGIFMLIPAVLGLIEVKWIMPPMFLYMFGSSWIFSNAFAGAFHFFMKISGFVGALYGAFQILGGTLFVGLFSFSHTATQTPIALCLIFVGVGNFFLQKLGHKFTLKCEK